MLDEHGVPDAVTHSPNRQRKSAKDQNFASNTHATPADESSFPV